MSSGTLWDAYSEAARLALLPYRLLTSRLRVLPDFVIFGCIKGGTTSLFEYMGRHPCVMRAIRKEVHWFDRRYHKGIGWYKAHFPTAAFKSSLALLRRRRILTGEATPSYILHPAAAQRMAQLLPEVKLIALLRNPADRAYSDFQMMRRYGFEARSFEEVMDEELSRLSDDLEPASGEEDGKPRAQRPYLTTGIYADQLKPWKTSGCRTWRELATGRTTRARIMRCRSLCAASSRTFTDPIIGGSPN